MTSRFEEYVKTYFGEGYFTDECKNKLIESIDINYTGTEELPTLIPLAILHTIKVPTFMLDRDFGYQKVLSMINKNEGMIEELYTIMTDWQEIKDIFGGKEKSENEKSEKKEKNKKKEKNEKESKISVKLVKVDVGEYDHTKGEYKFIIDYNNEKIYSTVKLAITMSDFSYYYLETKYDLDQFKGSMKIFVAHNDLKIIETIKHITHQYFLYGDKSPCNNKQEISDWFDDDNIDWDEDWEFIGEEDDSDEDDEDENE